MPPTRALTALVAMTLCAALPALLPVPAAGAARPVAATDAGKVRGVLDHGGKVFRGVPYAAAPTGDLRWRAPRGAARWKGVREAARPAAACAQSPSDLTGVPGGSKSEDCLTVDVYAPKGARRNLPVLVWLHGGAYTGGSGTLYDARRLAAEGAVVVTVNYRLGPFGYLALPGLSREDRGASGNYGLLDQRAALRWAKRNARAFGGDPGRVTVFGQSAGAGSVCALLAAPSARGLVQRAILQSSPACAARPLPTAEKQGASIAKELGCDDPACLRREPVAEVLSAAAKAFPALAAATAYGPVSGGPFLPLSPDKALAQGRFPKIPIIVGTTRDEGRIFAAALAAQGVPDAPLAYLATLASQFGLNAGRIAERYPVSAHGGSGLLATAAVLTDSRFSCPNAALAAGLAGRTRVHGYEFAEPDVPNLYTLKTKLPLAAYHGSELPLLFDLPDGPRLTAAQKALGRRMRAQWVGFAATGDPGWPRLGRGYLAMTAAKTGLTRTFPARHQCAFWATLS